MLLALRSLWESGTTPTPTSTLQPGRVYKGIYPYWTKKPRRRPVYDDEEDEIEELMVMLGIDL